MSIARNTLKLIITYDEKRMLNDRHGSIEVIPCWKWLLND